VTGCKCEGGDFNLPLVYILYAVHTLRCTYLCPVAWSHVSVFLHCVCSMNVLYGLKQIGESYMSILEADAGSFPPFLISNTTLTGALPLHF